jgi:FemAB-related protein (PEP-CTERM system-associated)
VNYGGLLTQDVTLATPILQQAMALRKRLGASYIELRHLENYYPHLPVRQEKVSMWLSLPETSEELLASFKSKLRSQIKKGEKNNLTVQIGSTELLEHFYAVFEHNMRDLGTPVYSKHLFRAILEAFPAAARLVIVRDENRRPLAVGFLLGYRERLEIPWAASLRAYNHLQSNMWLYWNCLRYACEHGYRIFDFGRSTPDAPTYKFKAQWGAQPVPHYWHYGLEAPDDIPHLNPQNTKFHLAIALWKRLPVVVARVIGPPIVKHLP